jgi:hypothetical protein
VADLSRLAALVGPDDLVLVYFSGHGGVLEDFLLDPSAAVGVPPDSRWIFPYGAIDPYGFYSDSDLHLDQAIHNAEMPDLLDQIPAMRRLLILDTCNSGGFVRSGADTDVVPPDYDALARVDREEIFERALQAYVGYVGGAAAQRGFELSAAGADEFSWESSLIQQGVFTYFLMESASLGDLNGDRLVTTLEAYAYAAAAIDTMWNQGDTFRHFYPHISGGAVDIVLFQVP